MELTRELSAGREAPMASAAAFALAFLKHSRAIFGHTDQRALFDAFLNDDSTVWEIQPAAGTVSLLDDSVRTSLGLLSCCARWPDACDSSRRCTNASSGTPRSSLPRPSSRVRVCS